MSLDKFFGAAPPISSSCERSDIGDIFFVGSGAQLVDLRARQFVRQKQGANFVCQRCSATATSLKWSRGACGTASRRRRAAPLKPFHQIPVMARAGGIRVARPPNCFGRHGLESKTTTGRFDDIVHRCNRTNVHCTGNRNVCLAQAIETCALHRHRHVCLAQAIET